MDRRRVLASLGALALPSLLPATSAAQGTFINPFEERPLGARAHPAKVEQLGGFYGNRALSAYVTDLGLKGARTSARFPDQFVFSVVNNAAFNAGTTVGGFIYVNVGLFPWLADEAEFMAIMGHEIGHAIHRHPAHSINRMQLSGKLTALFGMARPGNYEELKLKSTLLLAQYDQKEEFQSDDTALQVITKMGYDPQAAPTALNQMVLLENFYKSLGAGSDNAHPELESHPPSEARVRRSVQAIKSAGLVPGNGPRHQDRYLEMIDGLVLPPTPLHGGRPARLKVVTMKADTKLPDLIAAMASPIAKMEYLLALNGLRSLSEIKPGMKLKLLIRA